MNDIARDRKYAEWLGELKGRIRQSQIKAAVRVNSELLRLYWQMGSDIAERQKNAKWGDGFLKQLSHDLMEEFPNMKGFNIKNLYRIRQWYLFYNDQQTIVAQLVRQLPTAIQKTHLEEQLPIDRESVNSQQLATQFKEMFFSVPWGHHILVMQRCKDMSHAIFYLRQTVENNWSRATLDWQIDSQLFERQGKAVNNFEHTLPTAQGDLARQITKDPYVIDLMGIRGDMEEREIEDYLNSHISRFLLELGKGFTYYGRQVHLNVGGDDFFIDLLFYHVRLHCYVVIELKAAKFKPEHIGQLKFYVTAVDNQLRTENDNPTIGLLICKEKNDVVAEYTLRDVESPIGISSMEIYEHLMSNFKSELPTIEEIEDELKDK